jgi:hypothetical protein
MSYGRLLAVLGYSLKAGESFASQSCAHLYKSAGGCGFYTTDPAATRMRTSR